MLQKLTLVTSFQYKRNDVTKISLSRKGQVIKFEYITLKHEFNHKKMNFMSRTVVSDLKLTSPVSFSNFQTEEFFSYSLFISMRKEQQQPALLIYFAKMCQGLKGKKLNNFEFP